MLQIIWRNPRKLQPRKVAVLKVVSCDIMRFQLQCVYRSVSGTEGGALDELLVSPADPILCCIRIDRPAAHKSAAVKTRSEPESSSAASGWRVA